MTQLPEWAPAGLDVTRPGAGAHHVESDRHPRDEVAGYFLSFELVEPGFVFSGGQRRPDPEAQSPDYSDSDPHPERLAGYAGVGRKG